MNFLKRALKPGNLLVLLVIAALCFLPLHGTAIAQSDDDSLKSDETEIDRRQIVRRQIDVSISDGCQLKFDAHPIRWASSLRQMATLHRLQTPWHATNWSP